MILLPYRHRIIERINFYSRIPINKDIAYAEVWQDDFCDGISGIRMYHIWIRGKIGSTPGAWSTAKEARKILDDILISEGIALLSKEQAKRIGVML